MAFVAEPPISDLKQVVDVPDIDELIGEVIDQVQIREREVRDPEGCWHLLRIHPYRTMDNKIDGAVIVLLDVDKVKRGEEALRGSEAQLRLALEAGAAGTWLREVKTGKETWDAVSKSIFGLPADAERNHAGRETSHAPVGPYHHHGYSGPGEQVGQIIGRSVQFHILELQLLVYRRQLFVVDCISSFAVSSSSLVLCSSSLLERISSLAERSSSLAASCCSTMLCKYSLVAANSLRVCSNSCSSSLALEAPAPDLSSGEASASPLA